MKNVSTSSGISSTSWYTQRSYTCWCSLAVCVSEHPESAPNVKTTASARHPIQTRLLMTITPVLRSGYGCPFRHAASGETGARSSSRPASGPSTPSEGLPGRNDPAPRAISAKGLDLLERFVGKERRADRSGNVFHTWCDYGSVHACHGCCSSRGIHAARPRRMNPAARRSSPQATRAYRRDTSEMQY